MIWWNLILFVVSFVLTALLAPKPDIENARPDSLDPESFPRATENAPIPLVLGKVRMEAPNTIWYGDFQSVPIIEKIKISLFKKMKVVVGHRYYVGLDLALAMGPGTVLTAIFMDDKELWSGVTSSTVPTVISINKPSFWGGKKEGGGWVSTGTYYPGAFDLVGNPIDPYLEGVIGVGKVPAYLGTAHIVFNKALIGESSQLRKTAFILENYSNALGLSNAKVGEDMNPAEAIYQIMTNSWRGMGIQPSEIDLDFLRAMGETLLLEGNGCSIIVTAESNGKTLIQEIIRQIDAIAYQDPETGKIKFQLIRDDYNVNTLLTYDEDEVVRVVNFGRSGWDEVISQVKITFPQRNKESDAVAISQDMATFAMIGRLRSTTMSMPFVYSSVLANNIASRERSQLSVPLFRITLEMNRKAHVLRPGGVFKLDWPEYGFVGLVLRIQEFDLGSLLDGKIIIKCLQDKFALGNTVFAPPAGSSWVAPVYQPTTATVFTAIEMPKFLSERLEFPTPDGNVNIIPFVFKPGIASDGFDMISGSVSGLLEVREPESASYLGSGTLSVSYSNLAGLSNGIDSVTGLSITGASGTSFTGASTISDIRGGDSGLLFVNGEWMAYTTGIDGGGGNWTLTTIYRGLMGTRPLTHAIGVRVYEFSPELLGFGSLDDLLESGTAYYKILDRAGRKVQDETEVSQNSLVVNTFQANRPVRPGNLQLAGGRTSLAVNDFVNRNLTWVARNRRSSQLAFEVDAAETPDLAEDYNVDVMINGVRNATLSAIGVVSPYTIPFSLTNITDPNCEIRVFSKRTVGNLRTSITYAWLPFTMDQP